MARSHKISLLTLGLLSFSLEALGRLASPSPPWKRKTAKNRWPPKGCWTQGAIYFNHDYYIDDFYDRCRDYWLETGPSVSPSMSSKPSSLLSLEPSSEPSRSSTFVPTGLPSTVPSQEPSTMPNAKPSVEPSRIPSFIPTRFPSMIPSREPSTKPVVEPSAVPSQSPSLLPSNQPSMESSFIPSSMPSLEPSVAPTDSPTKSPIAPSAAPSKILSEEPSSSPSKSFSKEPSVKPSPSPSVGPSISYQPSSITTFTIPLSQFNIALTFESNNNRKLSVKHGEDERKLTLVREDLLFETVFILLSDSFTRNLEDFYALDLNLIHLNTETNYSTRTIQTTATYRFSGSVVLRTVVPVDIALIPSEADLEQKTLQAFSSYNGDISNGINDATHDSFRSWVISKVGSNSFDLSNSGDEPVIIEVSNGNGVVMITVAASIVAIISTLTAFGLIYNQTRARKSETAIPDPRKRLEQEEPILKNRKFLSPFLTVTPPDGRKKYFSKLDDESVSSKNCGNPLNPEQSMVDSSFEESYAESLQAPSLSASKIGDLESLAGMSALDNVRLNSVLQIDEDGQDVQSTASNDTGAFRKIWYGRKHKIIKERSIKKLSPPSKDSPAKFSPIITSQTKDTPDSEKSRDDSSLLEDQSNKGEYYGGSEDSVLFYNMLKARSTVSDSSEDINFNELYNGDGIASSSGTSVQLSDYDIMSR